jgi:DNA repair exonuclease SbcCD nuclease subunit
LRAIFVSNNMKILFTADIHIKLGQKNVPVDWARNRFHLFIEQFAEMQRQADYVIIGGDVFDRLPTMDEVELYFDFVASIKKPGFIIPGNHEMLKKDTTFLTYLKKATHRINPLVQIIDDFNSDLLAGDVDFIPYNKLKEYTPQDIDMHGRILITHVRGEIPPHVKPEVNLDLFSRWDVVLAGDLHSYENSQRNILYPGSPYTTSFHRSRVDTGAILLDVNNLEHDWLKFNLPQLIRKTVGVNDPKPPTDFDHTIYQVEGDMAELGDLEDSDLIDRKVIKRDTDSALILEAEMTLVEEVKEYLTYILQLPEETIEQVLKEMQSYAEKLELD